MRLRPLARYNGNVLFQFTHPVRGATYPDGSIYTLRGFNSRTPCGVRRQRGHGERSVARFNSRTPCGVRREEYEVGVAYLVFQFTHPVRGATARHARLTPRAGVSIHAPRAGCDNKDIATERNKTEFQFTHPVRGAT